MLLYHVMKTLGIDYLFTISQTYNSRFKRLSYIRSNVDLNHLFGISWDNFTDLRSGRFRNYLSLYYKGTLRLNDLADRLNILSTMIQLRQQNVSNITGLLRVIYVNYKCCTRRGPKYITSLENTF